MGLNFLSRPNFWPQFKQDLKAFYTGDGALRAFEQLVREHCDPEFLAFAVSAIRLGYQVYKKQPAGDSPFVFPGSGFESLAGFPRKKLKTVIGRMRDSARDIERLRAGFLSGFVPSGLQRRSYYIGLQSRLPSELFDLADLVERAAKHLRLRGRPEYDEDIAALVRHVEERTGKPHEPEVSAMIAFATNNPEFTAEDLRTWRMEHKLLLSSR